MAYGFAKYTRIEEEESITAMFETAMYGTQLRFNVEHLCVFNLKLIVKFCLRLRDFPTGRGQ